MGAHGSHAVHIDRLSAERTVAVHELHMYVMLSHEERYSVLIVTTDNYRELHE